MLSANSYPNAICESCEERAISVWSPQCFHCCVSLLQTLFQNYYHPHPLHSSNPSNLSKPNPIRADLHCLWLLAMNCRPRLARQLHLLTAQLTGLIGGNFCGLAPFPESLSQSCAPSRSDSSEAGLRGGATKETLSDSWSWGDPKIATHCQSHQ